MANADQLTLLLSGVDAWNEWRRENPDAPVDLSGANLFEANLTGVLLYEANLCDAILLKANLIGANLEEANLRQATLREANLIESTFWHADLTGACLDEANLYQSVLREANLTEASLIRAELTGADFTSARLYKADFYKSTMEDTVLADAKLCEAIFSSCNLFRTNFCGADLTAARLNSALMVGTDFRGATLHGCYVYGTSVWDIQIDEEKTRQLDLIITPPGETTITVDNLKVAQFIYLLLNNKEIREVIETIGRKIVLILGRFSEERKAVLNLIRDELRRLNYMPVLFDFNGPTNRNLIETVGALAHLARFVIADVTDPKMVIKELEDILPSLPSLPVKPIVRHGSDIDYSLTKFADYKSFLSLYEYEDNLSLIAALPHEVIASAEKKATEIEAELRLEKAAHV